MRRISSLAEVARKNAVLGADCADRRCIISKFEYFRIADYRISDELDVCTRLRRLFHLIERHHHWPERCMRYQNVLDAGLLRGSDEHQHFIRTGMARSEDQFVFCDGCEKFLDFGEKLSAARNPYEWAILI